MAVGRRAARAYPGRTAFRQLVRKSWLSVERFLLPNACVVCERAVESSTPDTLVCAVCRVRVRFLEMGCPRCQQPLPLLGSCRFCAGWPAALGSVTSAVWLTEETRAIVHHLKYQGYESLARLMAAWIARCTARPTGATLIPVPLARSRERRRGYNQSELLARALGAEWKLPVVPAALRRKGRGQSQTKLGPEERAANVTDVFEGAGALQGHRAIVVDDVLTTGATLAAAAATLEGSGWDRIEAVTFARALPFEARLIRWAPSAAAS